MAQHFTQSDKKKKGQVRTIMKHTKKSLTKK